MGASVETRSSGWKLFWGQRKPILLGLAFGSTLAALFPFASFVFRAGWEWVWNPAHSDKNGLPAAIVAILAVAAFIWPGPILFKWFKSSWCGVNRGSFALPAVATLVALGLRYPFPGLRFSLPLAWWVISILAIFALAARCLYVIYRRSESIHISSDESDNERRSIEDAWPARRDLAEQIASRIATEGKATYAIYGEFGSGKSSMLNFIEILLRSLPTQKPIVVRFNGWLSGSRDNLADQLLLDISMECSKRFFIPRLRRSTLRLARALATSVPRMGGLVEWIPQETQEGLIEDLRSTLERLPERVVVLVDEIDRMGKEELFTLLKLIRGFCSLPRLSFVCALERDHVERMIRDEYGAPDHTFYHKFFVESFPLPRLVDSFLESETRDALTAIFDGQGWFKGDSAARDDYSNAIHEHWRGIFAPLCTNARETKRLANSVRAQAWPLLGEVNPFDLTLVAALRYYAPAALKLIWAYCDVLCAHDIDGRIADPDKAYEAAVRAYLDQEGELVSDANLQMQVKRIRAVLFSGLEEINDSQSAESKQRLSAELRYFDLNKGAARTKRLRSVSYFPAYFQDALPVTIFPEKELTRIFDELMRSDELQGSQFIFREFKGLEGNDEKRLNFLEKLNDAATRALALGQCMWVANILVSLSSRIEEPTSGTEYGLIARFVTGVSDELFLAGKADVRLEFLRRCILAARSDGLAVRIFQRASIGRPIRDNITSVQRGIQPVPREELEGAYLQRMEGRYGPKVGLGQVDLSFSEWQAFGEWGKMLEKSGWAGDRGMQRDFWRRYISSPEGMSDFSQFVLAPMLLYIESPGHHAYFIEDILPKEEIRTLAQLYPPYSDPLAVSYLRELLGKDVIPEPVGPRPTM